MCNLRLLLCVFKINNLFDNFYPFLEDALRASVKNS